ncbi:MAG: SdrD B-like domain-containing protein [Pirellulaceae bacterium]|nr:SdrD B-like domain-containing protein [Pirellulaceae bacterium]
MTRQTRTRSIFSAKSTDRRRFLRQRLRRVETLESRTLMAVSIGDYVWNDVNFDGIQNEGPSEGVNGVQVTLFSSTGSQVGSPTQTTDNALGEPGYYAFNDIAPGDYYVVFAAPTGRAFTRPLQGSDSSLDSNASRTGRSDTFTLGAGVPNLAIDAGLVPTASVGTFVWWDENSDGLQADIEGGIEAATVRLLENGSQIASQLTDEFGQYFFTNLAPGTYQIQFDRPAGFEVASPADVPSNVPGRNDKDDSDGLGELLITAPFTLAPGEINRDVDQGFNRSAKVGNYVWRDANNNGIQDEAASFGVNGVTVTLFTGAGVQVGSPVVTANDSSGNPGYYLFNSLTPGQYFVRFTAPAGQVFTTSGAGTAATDSNANSAGQTATFNLAAGVEELSIDAGLRPIDLALVSAVTDTTPPVNATVTYSVTVSNASGLSAASGVTVADVLPAGLTYVSDNSGGNYNSATRTWNVGTVAPGASVLLQVVATVSSGGTKSNVAQIQTADQPDFDSTPGNAPGVSEDDDFAVSITASANIGNYVWRDVNNDGIQNESAAFGINGVTVTLFTSAGVQVGLPVVTANDAGGNPGFYAFNDINPGNYYVVVSAPAGQVFTTQFAGAGTPANDSNVDSTGRSGVFTLVSGVDDLSIDAGLRSVDLSLTNTVSNPSPRVGTNVIYTLTVSNASGASSATGVTVLDLLPSGLTFVSSSGVGSYDSGTGVWTIGTVAAGASASLQITTTIDSGGTKTNLAQIQTVDQPDFDSTPGNAPGVSEDDDATSSLTPPASISNYVWRDVNNDGIQNEAASFGINGVTVTLFTSAGVQVGLPVVTANSGADPGFYSFVDIIPGDYYIVVTAPGGQVFTTQFAGSPGTPETDSNVDSTGKSNTFSLVSGVDETTVDSGFRPIDLGLTKTVSDLTPQLGTNVTFTTTVTNADGLSTATDVTVLDALPAGVTFVSSSGAGTYDNTTGVWTIGSIAPGTSITLQVVATVTAGGVKTSTTQIQTAGQPDFDSTPGNAPGVREDDDVTTTVTPSATIGNYVWRDDNNDGIQNEPANAGLNGVTVRLFTSAGAQVGAAIITANDTSGNPGYYAFSDIDPGSYYVVVTAPADLTFTTQFAAAATSTTDSNVDATGQSNTFTLASGIDDLSIDAGLKSSQICAVFDFNGNTATSGTLGNIRTFTSGSISVNASGFSRDRATGAWAPAYLGSYGGGLGVTDPSEGNGAGDAHTVDNLGGRDNYILFAFNQPVVIDSAYLGYVVTDSDLQVWIGTIPGAFNNQQTLSDSLLAGLYTEYNWTTLSTARLADLNANGILGNVIIIAADASDTSPEDRFKLGQLTLCTPGTQQPASLGNFVWHDLNGNGLQEAHEPGIPDARVTLTGGGADGIINGVGDTVVSTTTSSTGAYSFTGLVPGTQYRAAFAIPTGFTSASPRKLGSNASLDSDGLVSDIVILGSGQNNTTIDAGFYNDVRVGNYVWNDTDRDGFQDSTETGIGGVTLSLTGTSGSGASVNLTTTTAANGSYMFSALPPGTYQVRVTSSLATGVLAGFAASPTLVGTDRGLDSNVNPSSTSPATLASGSSDLSVDFGYYLDTTRACVNLFLEGNTATSGTAGNILTFSSGVISARASGFSRDSAGRWSTAFLGRYGGGLGVTDSSEGSGSGNLHTVDNIGRNNYVLFAFSQAVTVDTAFLGYVSGDSDIRVWIGNAANAFTNQPMLSDAFLSGLGFTEVNLGDGRTRTADINAGNLMGNILVISANTLEATADDQFKIAELGLCAMVPTSHVGTKFFTVDDDSNKSFKYTSTGTFTQDFASASLNPRGITSNVSGSNVWISDTNGRIFNYTSAGVLVANWSSRISGLQGVTTNGTHIWTVNDVTDRVYYYPNGTTIANGASVHPTSSFPLNYYNSNPTDLTTDGTFIWVVNEGNVAGGVGDMVFKYTVSGRYLGRWQIDSANARPTGITVDPAGGNKLWIVDNSTDRIYEYSGATGCISGGLVASRTYALAAGNTNPQGIADPPGPGEEAVAAESSLVVNEQYINTDVNPSFNTFNATDVNSDGVTSPLDALLVINRLNARISGQQATSEAWIYDDVSNDRSLSPIDALLVINQLNAASRSASGTPVTPVPETEPNVGSNSPDALGLGSGEGESVAARDAYFAAYTPAYVIEAESENGSFRTGDRSVRNLRRGPR